MAEFPDIFADGSLFARLRASAIETWQCYVDHPFVRRLADGSLEEGAFRHYLIQDYLFLIHFARAYALAAYKAEDLDEMRQATATLSALIDQEMALHVEYCAGWGISRPELERMPEAMATTAYTRFVIDTGLRGDSLELAVALAPCVVGYAEIAQHIKRDPATRLEGNRYGAWIDTYSSHDYIKVARAAVEQLDRLDARRGGAARFGHLAEVFEQATRLEAAFWQMGLDHVRAAARDDAQSGPAA